MSTEYVQVKDYERFQHYKDRDPPWIKLYVRLLEDYHFARLPDASKAHLILVWVLASRLENKIPKDAAWIGRQIGATEPVDLVLLMAEGWLQPWDAETAKGKREDWASRYIPKKVREEVLAVGRCAECGGREHLEVDHIIPVSRGGTSGRDNLQALCRKCNRIKRVRLSVQAAEHPPTQVLRRETDLRTTETETEGRERRTFDRRRDTWLTPFADAWSGRCGKPPFGKLAAVLGPLVKQHEEPEVLARWSRYLNSTEPKFCSAHRFAETFNTWAEPETVEMTDDFGVMRLHRRNAAGQWEVAS